MNISRVLLAGAFALAASAGLSAVPGTTVERGAKGAALGIFLGQPTGITFRYGLSGEQSLEAKAAWDLSSYGGNPSFSFQANWLLEFPGIPVAKDVDLPLYLGAGIQSDVDSSSASFGFRIPFGIMYRLKKAPLELNLEIGIGMRLLPGTAFRGSGGLGLRYRF